MSKPATNRTVIVAGCAMLAANLSLLAMTTLLWRGSVVELETAERNLAIARQVDSNDVGQKIDEMSAILRDLAIR